MPDVLVAELRPVYASGERQLRLGAIVGTNDQGEYRIWGLNPGPHYILAVHVPRRQGKVLNNFAYLPTFYPGELDAPHATPLVARAGDQFSDIVIDMQPARAATVRGRPYGEGQNLKVFLLLRDILATGDLFPPLSAEVKIGDYEFAAVTPGSYYLYATADDLRGGQLVTRQPITIGASVNRFDLTLQKVSELTGNVIVEGAGRPGLSWEVTFSPRNGRMLLGEAPSVRTAPNGSFTLPAFSPGDYLIRVEKLPGDWYLKSARLEGLDVLGSGWSTDLLPFPKHLDLIISQNGATVDGIVYKDQKLYSGATVALVPDQPRRGDQPLYKWTSTDEAGRFVIQGISPGDYKLLAWESVEDGAYTNAEFLEPFEVHGEAAHLKEGSHVSVNLDLIPQTDVVP
jgi:hypothetical protein